MITLRRNLKARLLTGQIPHAISKVSREITAEHIHGRDAAGAQTPEAAFGLSQFKASLQALAQEHSTRGCCTLITAMNGGNGIFANMLCPACQNSFVWKLHNGECQRRPRSRAMGLLWQNERRA